MARKSKGSSSARASSSGKKSASGADSGSTPSIAMRIGWLALAGVVVFLLASLVSFDAADPPSHAAHPVNDPPANWCGRVGAFLAFHTYYTFGHGVWVAIVLALAYLVATIRGRRVGHPVIRACGAALMALAISGFQHLWFPTSGPFPEGGGGLVAIAGVDVLVTRFNPFGTALILLLMFGVGAVVALDELVIGLPLAVLRGLGVVRKVPVGRALAFASRLAPGRRADEEYDELADESAATSRRGRRSKKKSGATTHIDPDAGGIGGVEAFDPDEEEYDEDEEDEYEYEDEYDEDYDDDEEEYEDEEELEPAVAESGEVDMEALREKIRRLPVNFASRNRAAPDAEPDLPRTEDYSGYEFPPIDLLEDPEESYSEQMEEYVREQAEALETAMRTYRIDGEVVGIDSGPVITLYEVQLAPGTKVAALNSISSDLARALRAPNIRIVPNMAGKTTVGVEVPNQHKEKVRVKELMSISSKAGKMLLPMFLGKDASGTPLVADLTSMPHMLIAGTTGSGKSVCMNTIIMSFLYTKRPDELKLILVDPKMVEMSQFKEIPHLMCPVVTEMDKASAILEWAVTKMEERYELLAEAGVRDIAGYNALEWDEIKERMGPMSEAEEAKIPKKLPFIVFIIDELADLIMTNKEVESFIVRIAQKARAVGIHLILATQRPQANVVTGLIKSNMPCRISFKVASGMDSRIVLDQKGAELLLGQGDMLFLSPRTSTLLRAQGTLVEDLEIRKVTKFLKTVAAPSFERQLMTIRSSSANEGGGDDADFLSADKRDPLFFKAVDIIVESGRGSVSLLQRRLAIGYTRASRLIDQMGLAGIIGEHKGSVAREVLVAPEEWIEMRKVIENEEAAETLFARNDAANASLAAGVSDDSPATAEPRADAFDDDEVEDDETDDDYEEGGEDDDSDDEVDDEYEYDEYEYDEEDGDDDDEVDEDEEEYEAVVAEDEEDAFEDDEDETEEAPFEPRIV
ncbi:MAG: DNA translocase FtsK [Phycisphaerales bacterium]